MEQSRRTHECSSGSLILPHPRVDACFLACWHICELRTWQHIKAQSSYVDVTTGKVRRRWCVSIGPAHQSSRCVHAHQYLNLLCVCVFVGTPTCAPLWGYVVVFVKTNNIPAVFNIPASHTLLPDCLWHNAAIGPVGWGSTVTNCSPHSGHASPARPLV